MWTEDSKWLGAQSATERILSPQRARRTQGPAQLLQPGGAVMSHYDIIEVYYRSTIESSA